MSFWEHLDELRKVIFRSALSVLILMVIVFLNKSFVFDTVIFAPASSDFVLYDWFRSLANLLAMPSLAPDPFRIELINIELSAQFFIHISVSFTIAIILSLPYIFYQIWLFIKPALYDNERIAARKAFMFASVLFFIGALVGYFFVFPLTVRFLGTYQVASWVVNKISLQSYISTFTWMIIIMGVVFEMPALAALLSRIGILGKKTLKRYRKHAFVVLIIIAAIITPSGDAFTLFIVGMPMYILYEFSILVCRDLDK